MCTLQKVTPCDEETNEKAVDSSITERSKSVNHIQILSASMWQSFSCILSRGSVSLNKALANVVKKYGCSEIEGACMICFLFSLHTFFV